MATSSIAGAFIGGLLLLVPNYVLLPLAALLLVSAVKVWMHE